MTKVTNIMPDIIEPKCSINLKINDDILLDGFSCVFSILWILVRLPNDIDMGLYVFL